MLLARCSRLIIIVIICAPNQPSVGSDGVGNYDLMVWTTGELGVEIGRKLAVVSMEGENIGALLPAPYRLNLARHSCVVLPASKTHIVATIHLFCHLLRHAYNYSRQAF